jgi:hypothetical protein
VMATVAENAPAIVPATAGHMTAIVTVIVIVTAIGATILREHAPPAAGAPHRPAIVIESTFVTTIPPKHAPLAVGAPHQPAVLALAASDACQVRPTLVAPAQQPHIAQRAVARIHRPDHRSPTRSGNRGRTLRGDRRAAVARARRRQMPMWVHDG